MDAVRDLLVARGFRVVSPEGGSVAELADALAGAAICVGVEGSALTHATMLMPPGGAILTLQPPRHVADAIKYFADAVGLRFAFVIGDDRPAGYTIDEDRLIRTLALVEDAIGRHLV